MVIYVDTLFLLNGMVDYLLLLASARLAGEPLFRVRFALGAVFGGLYAVAIFLPGLAFLVRPPCRLAAAVLMVLLAFWRSRRLLRQMVIFLPSPARLEEVYWPLACWEDGDSLCPAGCFTRGWISKLCCSPQRDAMEC